MVVGKTVTIANISELPNSQVFFPFAAHNAAQSSSLVPANLRTYEGSRRKYVPSYPLKTPGSITGEVVAADVLRTSLVVRPKLLGRLTGISIYWATLVDEDGAPLVSIEDTKA